MEALSVVEFEQTTGWQLQSHYAPLAPSIHEYLASFYSKYNELLFELLSTRLDDHW